MSFEELARINFIFNTYTVILLLGLIAGIYYIFKSKKIEKELKFIISIGLIFVVFMMYYTPKYYAEINIQKKILEETQLKQQQFDKEFEQKQQQMNQGWGNFN
jgi:uncharacterized membrane protein YozB (DUF420 family)